MTSEAISGGAGAPATTKPGASRGHVDAGAERARGSSTGENSGSVVEALEHAAASPRTSATELRLREQLERGAPAASLLEDATQAPSSVASADDDAGTLRCAWCEGPMPPVHPFAPHTRFCKSSCRQSAFRVRRRLGREKDVEDVSNMPARFVYADPPYPGKARKYYGREPDYAGEVDHRELVGRLERMRLGEGCAGWALSTSADALRDVLPLCPRASHPCPWVKTHAPGNRAEAFGPFNAWEAVILMGGRVRRHGSTDWLASRPAVRGGRLPGRKPIAFVAWLWRLFGALPGDELVDLFPGTGIVGRAWAELSRVTPAAANAAAGRVAPRDRDAAAFLVDVVTLDGGAGASARETSRPLPRARPARA